MVQLSSMLETRRSNKMKKQPKYGMKKLDSGFVPIILTLNDVPLKVKKNPESEPFYIDHL
jgi:hypothetical protein